jgi:A/G-specific adenine glycosylase
MLQQTTVQAVFPYFERWMDKYPAIEDLAAAEPEQVLRDWEGLGYYSRARNLHASAREVMLRYGGTIPKDPCELQKLPGIGGYTAAAVASIAFGVRVPALDANNLRVWSRILASSDRKRITRIFNRCLPAGRPGDFNQALMDLGSLVCTPRDPDCPACPISGWCRAHRTDRVEKFPRRGSRSKITRLEAAIGIIVEDNKVLVQKRPENGLLAGLWEFPGGKIRRAEGGGRRAEKRRKPGGRRQETEAIRQKTEVRSQNRAQKDLETPEEAVVREVREETGLRVQVRQKLGVFTHSYTRFNVKLHVFMCKKKSGRLHRPEAWWVTLDELQRLPMPSVNRRIVKKLEEYLTAEDAE